MQACEDRDDGVAGQLEGNGPTTRVTRGPMSQYLPQHPESSPTDEQIKDQKENGEENPYPQVHAHTHTPAGDVFQASPQQ